MATVLSFIRPMECLATSRLPEGAEWSYEAKLDGYRAQVINGNRLRLLSRRGKDFSSRFRDTYSALASVAPVGSIFDGELVALDSQGRPNFSLIQNSKTGRAPIVFFAFDILALAGRDLRILPLSERQQLLRDSLRSSELVQISESFQIPATRMISLVEEHGLEGVVAKRLSSLYESGRRSGSWQKLCLVSSQEFVVGGFTPGRHGIDSLQIGFNDGRNLRFCASVRAGFVPAARRQLYSLLEPLATDRCPFSNLPERSSGRWGEGLTLERMRNCIWVRPRVVVRCAFQEWTASDHLRRASYVGIRDDKEPRDVIKEA